MLPDSDKTAVSNVGELKRGLCNILPILAELSAEDLCLSIDGFELLDNSPINVVHENDLVCVAARLDGTASSTVRKRGRVGVVDVVPRKRRRGTSEGSQKRAASTLGRRAVSRNLQAIPLEADHDSSATSSTTSASSSSRSDETSSSSDSEDDTDSTTSTSSSSSSSTPSVHPTANRRISPASTKNASVESVKPVLSDTAAAAKATIPPGYGKTSTHSRNARRKRKRQFERSSSLAVAQAGTAVSNESANATPLGIRTVEPNGQPQDDIVVQDVSTGFDVSKLDSTLHNKNKRRAFSRAVNTDTPKRIVFADDEGVRENVPLRPRLVRPSERAEKGQLPDNVFVTSVEVEEREDTWSRRSKKKKRDDYGFAENEEEEEAEVTLDYGVDETAPMDQSEAVETRRSLGAEEWKVIEERWSAGLYKTITVPLDIKVDDIVGFTEMGINPATCSPDMLLQLARITRIDADNNDLYVRKYVRPGVDMVGFGSRAVESDVRDEQPLDDLEDEETKVAFADVLIEGWRLVRSGDE